MRLLHTADLHIGKTVNDFSMLEDQKEILSQILLLARENQVDGVILAGDIYDRAVPSGEAVLVFNDFLTRLAEANITVYMISGNHDSPERISFGEVLLKEQGVMIAGVYHDEITVIPAEDSYGKVDILLLPFLHPSKEGEKSSGAAVRNALSKYWEKEGVLPAGTAAESGRTEPERAATESGRTEPERAAAESDGSEAAAEADGTERNAAEELQEKKRRILVTHFFVTDAGEEPVLSDSETTIHVGGIDNVDASVFEGLDYVALGHIHRPQQIGNRPVYYAGSPLAYSFSEAGQEKKVLLIDLQEKGTCKVTGLPLTPLKKMRKIEGTMEELLAGGEKDEQREDYIQAILTDEKEMIDPMGVLRSVYPNLMQVVRKEILAGGRYTGSSLLPEKREPVSILEDFYSLVREETLTEEKKELLIQMIKEAEA